MIRPRKMPHPPPNSTIRIPRPLSSELPNHPFVPMSFIQEFGEGFEVVAIGALGVGCAGAGGGYDYGVGRGRDVAEI